MPFLRRRGGLPPEPDCRQVGRVLQAFLDGELGPEDAEKVLAHLELCDVCSIEAATVRQVMDAIRRHRPELDGEQLERLERHVHSLADDRGSREEG